MERQLEAIKDGYLFAQVSFTYDTPDSGQAGITTYQPVEDPKLDGLLKPVIPVLYYTIPFSFSAPDNREEMEAADLAFLAAQFADTPGFDISKVTCSYTNGTFTERKLLYQENTLLGTATIVAGFMDNHKILQFVSAWRINADCNLSTDSLESNPLLLDRLAAILLGQYQQTVTSQVNVS